EMRRRDMLQNRHAGSDNRAWSHGDNESSHGICLRMNNVEDRYPEAGQVVALIRQKNQQKILEVGLVQWCAIDQDSVPYCGVTRLEGVARKVTIINQDEQSAELNGLLVVAKTADGRARSLLVVPASSLNTSGRTQLY